MAHISPEDGMFAERIGYPAVCAGGVISANFRAAWLDFLPCLFVWNVAAFL